MCDRATRPRCRFHAKGRPATQFCGRGHNILITGRNKNDGQCLECCRENHIRSRYGISPEGYNQLFQNQQGKCAICQKHQSEIKRKFFVDHCHETGKVRGLLCSSCNLRLSGIEDIEYSWRAKEYLEIFNEKIAP